MKPCLHNHRGMTTIELLIVITVLGIMATLVYPHFNYVTENANESVHKQQVKMIRMAIAMYRIEHGGQIPNLLGNWDDLTKTSIYRGRTFGPYLSETPKNHKRSNVFDGYNVDPPDDRYGFVYDYNGGGGTGEIWVTNGSGKKLKY